MWTDISFEKNFQPISRWFCMPDYCRYGDFTTSQGVVVKVMRTRLACGRSGVPFPAVTRNCVTDSKFVAVWLDNGAHKPLKENE